MSSLWMVVIGLCCAAVFGLTGCGSGGVRAGAASPGDVYLAAPRAVVANNVPPLSISNLVGGGITIITGNNNEIAPDVIATGTGANLEQALEEADSHINLINTGTEVKVEATAGANPQDRAHLHVRVPPGINLSAVAIPQGNVGVYGRVGNVTAVISGDGNINVFGASGDINLSTGQGSIAAELAPGNNNVTARASGGSADIVALTAALNVTITNGSVRFLGTLRNDRHHSITISGTGNIDLALPAYLPGKSEQMIAQPYRIDAATLANPIITDYPPTVTVGGDSRALTICGFIHSSGPYDYHIENTPMRHFGRIEVSPALTSAFFFSGTLGADYYRFDTDRPNVLIYAPVSQSIHIYTAEQLNQIRVGKAEIDPGCKGALNSPDGAAIVLNLKTDRGRIYLRHIFLKKS